MPGVCLHARVCVCVCVAPGVCLRVAPVFARVTMTLIYYQAGACIKL
jgi:hypothetical protein